MLDKRIRFVSRDNKVNPPQSHQNSLDMIKKEIETKISDRLISFLNDNSLELVITIVSSPTTEELEGSHKHSNNVRTIVSKLLESESCIYALRNRIGSISIPSSVDLLLVAFGLEEYIVLPSSNNLPLNDETPVFHAKDPKWTLDDVLLVPETKERIIRALSIIENKDLIFNTWGFSKTDKSTKSIICFYGPAGTGKTMSAEAIASYLNKRIVHSSYAEIESQWVGVGAKNLHAIFQFAEDNDAVLFFDEADSFLSSRIESTKGGSDKHYNRMTNELFQLLESFNGCVVFATNLLTDVDEAFKSRIIDSIKFDLPDKESRILLIRKLLPQSFPLQPVSDDQYSELSDLIDGFSGRDIRKSLLLSLASASILAKKHVKETFDYEDLKVGFLEVLEAKKIMDLEEGIIPNEVVEDMLSTREKNEAVVDMAIYAMYSDGSLHPEEVQIINELSRALLGLSQPDPIELPKATLGDICHKAKNNQWINDILDVATRVISADGVFADGERAFLQEVLDNLGLSTTMQSSVFEYTEHLAAINKQWKKILENDI